MRRRIRNRGILIALGLVFFPLVGGVLLVAVLVAGVMWFGGMVLTGGRMD